MVSAVFLYSENNSAYYIMNLINFELKYKLQGRFLLNSIKGSVIIKNHECAIMHKEWLYCKCCVSVYYSVTGRNTATIHQ